MMHKHYELIVAKAANMDLVVFIQPDKSEWEEVIINKNCLPSFDPDFNYFLCLPQHKEAVLNSLNGGESQLTFNGTTWDKCNLNQPVEWSEDWWYMKGESQSRIKPKKEKRWIAVDPSRHQQSTKLFKSENDLWSYFGDCAGNASGYQFIEIEVEV